MRLMQITIVLGILATPAYAQSIPEGVPDARAVVWRCWYSEDRGPAVACRLLQAPEVVAQLPVVTGTSVPVFSRIRNNPRSLGDEVMLIPLHAPPLDMAFTARLARAVMCGARPSCVVDFGSEPRS